MKTTVNTCKLIGEIGVDAGLCWIGDPCYILHTDKAPQAIGKDWSEFCDTLDSNTEFRQYDCDHGHPGLGVVVSTGYGDGTYPVFAEFNDDGRVAKVWVEFIGQNESDEAQEA
jgi:Protein of unknown function (DUF4241)